ncbi:MAG: hypothetical protein AB8B93_16940 [Pseudomonadales bacterium]
MTRSRLTEAVLNNAAWCRAIADSHNVDSIDQGALWYCDKALPRLYPNIVTLAEHTPTGALIETLDTRLAPGWGIKDSFSDLDLLPAGFTKAFDAQWYCRPAAQQTPSRDDHDYTLSAVTDERSLLHWSNAWGNGADIFNPALIRNAAVELVYVERGGAITAGLALNRTGGVVGLSNVFGKPSDLLACVSLVARQHPDDLLVGYGDTTELAAVSPLGFEPIGPLRVWVRNPAKGSNE